MLIEKYLFLYGLKPFRGNLGIKDIYWEVNLQNIIDQIFNYFLPKILDIFINIYLLIYKKKCYFSAIFN